MNRFLYLITLLLLPVLALGQSTATLDGSYISNMRSSPNFVVNPNCQKNTYAVVSAAGSTISRSTTTPIAAGTECNVADANAWEARWGVRTVDAGMSNRLCEVGMTLRGAASGTTTLQVLDNTTPVFTQIVALDATNPKRIGGTFPCGSTLNQFSVLLSGTDAITQTIEAGNVYLGEPVSVSSGAVVTEWQSYTPTFSAGLGTTTNVNFKYRRVGDTMEIQGAFVCGTVAGTSATVSLPFTADTSKLSLDPNNTVGYVSTAVGSAKAVIANTSAPSQIQFADAQVNTALAGNVGFATGANVSLFARIPVSGWSATDIVTPESSISGQARYSTNSANTVATGGGNTVIDFEDKTYDINSEVVTGSSWKYTAKTAGYYQVNAKIRFANSQAWTAGGYIALKLYKTPAGGAESLQQYSDQTFDASTTPAQGPSLRLTDVVYLGVGDALQLKAAHGEASDRTLVLDGTFNQVSISKVTGPGSQSFYLQGPTKGGNSGNAIPTGYVGEKATTTLSNSAALTTGTVINAASITLNKGRWLIFGKAYFEIVSVVTSISTRVCSISTTSTTHNPRSTGNSLSTEIDDGIVQALPLVVDVTVDGTSVYLTASSAFVVGAGQQRINGANSELYAIRLD